MMSVAISDISNVFNAHFNNGNTNVTKSDNLSQKMINSSRTPSNHVLVTTSLHKQMEDDDVAEN